MADIAGFAGIAATILQAIQGHKADNELRRLGVLLEHVNRKASSYHLPEGFDKQEEFQTFAAAVFRNGQFMLREDNADILASVLLNAASHADGHDYDVRAKILDLIAVLRPVHVELLGRFHQVSQVPPESDSPERPRLSNWESQLTCLSQPPAISLRQDLFYSAASDLVRWFLVRSTVERLGAVDIGNVADFIPGVRNMSHLRVTGMGERVLAYLAFCGEAEVSRTQRTEP